MSFTSHTPNDRLSPSPTPPNRLSQRWEGYSVEHDSYPSIAMDSHAGPSATANGSPHVGGSPYSAASPTQASTSYLDLLAMINPLYIWVDAHGLLLGLDDKEYRSACKGVDERIAQGYLPSQAVTESELRALHRFRDKLDRVALISGLTPTPRPVPINAEMLINAKRHRRDKALVRVPNASGIIPVLADHPRSAAEIRDMDQELLNSWLSFYQCQVPTPARTGRELDFRRRILCVQLGLHPDAWRESPHHRPPGLPLRLSRALGGSTKWRSPTARWSSAGSSTKHSRGMSSRIKHYLW